MAIVFFKFVASRTKLQGLRVLSGGCHSLSHSHTPPVHSAIITPVSIYPASVPRMQEASLQTPKYHHLGDPRKAFISLGSHSTRAILVTQFTVSIQPHRLTRYEFRHTNRRRNDLLQSPILWSRTTSHVGTAMALHLSEHTFNLKTPCE